jgi:hypothetical protein
VIAVENVDRPARGFSLVIQVRQPPNDGLLLVSPVQDVARLNDDEIASDPLIERVDRACEPERCPGGGQITVKVADAYESRRRFQPRGVWVRRRRSLRGRRLR